MFKELISFENLFSAWNEFHTGKSSRPDIMGFEFRLEDNLFVLHEELDNFTYKHGPYHTFHISDPKPRIISKATVRDRIVQHLVFRELYRLFDPTFIFHSYSSRLGKGTHFAVRNLSDSLRRVSHNYTLPTFALKCDIKQFFASVSHQKLFSIIKRKIKDDQFLWLVKEVIESFSANPKSNIPVLSGGGGLNESVGLPIGNVTSQIFANIYLNELDQYIKHTLKVRHYFRYADDFVLLSNNHGTSQAQLEKIDNFVQWELSLKLHPNKVSIRKFSEGVDFLGYVILPHHITLRTKTKRRMFKKLGEKQRLWEVGILSTGSLNQSLQSYLGVLKHGNCYWLRREVLNEEELD